MRGIVARIESNLLDRKTGQSIEAVVPIAQIAIIGIGLIHTVFVRVLDAIKTFRLRDVERAKDQAV
jgi:hypothetical protein